jgi:phosphohistidine phosphatase
MHPGWAAGLRPPGVRPSLIVTSPATRALQTAQLVAREIGYPLEFLQREPDLYLASPQEMLQVIARQDDAFRDILLCGHNPGITELASQLTGAAIDNVPTCGMAVIEARITSWSGLRAGARLCLFDSPKAHGPQGPRDD